MAQLVSKTPSPAFTLAFTFLSIMPALTRAQLAKDSEQLHQPLFLQAQTQPKRQRQCKVKQPTHDIDPLQ